MADKKFSGLPAATQANLTDLFAKADQGGAPSQGITLSQIKTLLDTLYMPVLNNIALVDGAAVTVTPVAGQITYFNLSTTTNPTLNMSIGGTAGQQVCIRIGAAGANRTVTLGANFKNNHGALGLTTVVQVGKQVMLTFQSDGTSWWETDGRECRGMIKPWYSTIASIPDGWVLCDGSNGTPDWRDVSLVGARSDNGGVAKTNVTGSLTASGGNFQITPQLQNTAVSTQLDNGADIDIETLGGTWAITAAGNVSNGNCNTINSMNPYVASAFIMKL